MKGFSMKCFTRPLFHHAQTSTQSKRCFSTQRKPIEPNNCFFLANSLLNRDLSNGALYLSLGWRIIDSRWVEVVLLFGENFGAIVALEDGGNGAAIVTVGHTTAVVAFARQVRNSRKGNVLRE